MNKNLFLQIVKNEFQFLQDQYGFSAPVIEDLGREIFVSYDRDNQTVSISYEFGSSPLVEIFEPSSDLEESDSSWASKNGVNRSRRFPNIRVTTRFSDDETSMVKYVKEMSSQFENVESDWLKV